MLFKVIAQTNRKPQPEVFLPYTWSTQKFPQGITSVFFLRTETNGLAREKFFGQAYRTFQGTALYIANLSPAFNSPRNVYAQHSNLRYDFAHNSSALLNTYPEITEAIHSYFGQNILQNKKIIGAYEALPLLDKIYTEYGEFVSRLHTTREKADFLFYHKLSDKSLHAYGQDIVSYGDYLIVNPHLPHFVATTDQGNYGLPKNSATNNKDKRFFVAVIQVDSEKTLLRINETIKELYHEHDLLIAADYSKNNHYQYNTFHLSLGYIEALFDTMSFVFSAKGNPTSYLRTPLGKELKLQGVTEKEIRYLQKHPLFRTGKQNKLYHLIEDNKNMDFKESVLFFLSALKYIR